MRIISQSRKIDVPYENVALSIGVKGEKYTICGHTPYENRPCILAEYNSEGNAERALEVLREAYRANQYALSIVSGTAIIKGLTPSEIENVKSLSANAKASCIFQFPADEDVEV